MGIASIFTILLLNTFGLASHASAMPMMSHEMGGMDHRASSSTNCATLCRTAVFNKEEATNPSYEEKDVDPFVPYYIQFGHVQFSEVDTKGKLYNAKVKPPPKIPIYILYSVFRA